MIRRRSLLLSLAALPVLSAARAQTGKVYRVGLITAAFPLTEKSPPVIGLAKAFAKRGYTTGNNLVLETRAAEGKIDLLPKLVGELNAD